jgi:hypothetical protein
MCFSYFSLVCIEVWKVRPNGDITYSDLQEIIKYCTKCHLVGTFLKLIKNFGVSSCNRPAGLLSRNRHVCVFYAHQSVNRESILKMFQQDGTFLSHILFPTNSCTCFGWNIHPSSGARINCSYSIWQWQTVCGLPSSLDVPTQPKTTAGRILSVTTRCCNYSLCSWWWLNVSPETCTAV